MIKNTDFKAFYVEEMREKLLHKAEMLQEGMRRSGLPHAEIEKFGQWASDVDFALANSDRYGQEG